MTDRELLLLAAKAGAIELWPGDSYRASMGSGLLLSCGRILWNSLSDKGDAMELQVKLKIRTEPTDNYAVAYAGSVCAEQFTVPNGDDPVLAMCRAITRAAAHIGKEMP